MIIKGSVYYRAFFALCINMCKFNHRDESFHFYKLDLYSGLTVTVLYSAGSCQVIESSCTFQIRWDHWRTKEGREAAITGR